MGTAGTGEAIKFIANRQNDCLSHMSKIPVAVRTALPHKNRNLFAVGEMVLKRQSEGLRKVAPGISDSGRPRPWRRSRIPNHAARPAISGGVAGHWRCPRPRRTCPQWFELCGAFRLSRQYFRFVPLMGPQYIDHGRGSKVPQVRFDNLYVWMAWHLHCSGCRAMVSLPIHRRSIDVRAL
jgi:hypothetical protein